MRKLRDIRQDLRRTWDLVAVSQKMKDGECERYYVREAQALEQELTLRTTGLILKYYR